MQLQATNLLACAIFSPLTSSGTVGDACSLERVCFKVYSSYLNFLEFFKTIMYVAWIMYVIIACLTCRNCVATDGTLVNINKYCRDRDRLITSEENDEYLLVGAKNNTNIMLACRYW